MKAAEAVGVRRLRPVAFGPQREEEGYGCDGHPSAATQRRMAAELVPVIAEALGW